MPAGEIVARVPGQLHAALHVQREHALLADRLAFALVHPFLRPVRRDHEQWDPLVERFRDRRTVIQDRTAAGADQRNGCMELLGHSQGEEARATLIDHLQALDIPFGMEGAHQGSAARPRADHHVPDTLGGREPGQFGRRVMVAREHGRLRYPGPRQLADQVQPGTGLQFGLLPLPFRIGSAGDTRSHMDNRPIGERLHAADVDV